MKLPLRVQMASEAFLWDASDLIPDYVHALLDADGGVFLYTDEFKSLSKETADLIVAAVNAYQGPKP